VDRAGIEPAASTMPIDTSFKSLFKRFKGEFENYLRHVRKVSDRVVRVYMSAMERLPEIKKLEDFAYVDLPQTSVKAYRIFIHFLADIKGYTTILELTPEQWLKPAKVEQSKPQLTFVGDNEILDSFWACPKNLQSFYKLACFTGGRGLHLFEMCNNFDPAKVIQSEDHPQVSYYPTTEYSKGNKNTYFVFFPSEFKEELSDFKMPYKHPHTVYKHLQETGVNVKSIRKWHANTLFKNGVQESIVDYLQGRTARSVAARHYYNLNLQACRAYGTCIDKFPMFEE